MNKLIVFSIFFTIIFSGCKEEKKDPQQVVSSFIESFHKRDFAKLKELSTEESKKNIDYISILNGIANKNLDTIKFSPDNFKYDKPVINGTDASIDVTDAGSGFKTTYYLKDEDGWKVSFTLNSILKGLQNNDSSNVSLPPGLLKSMDKFKNVNIDSIMGDMTEKFQKLSHSQKDSIKDAVNSTIKEFSKIPHDSLYSEMEKRLKSVDTLNKAEQ